MKDLDESYLLLIAGEVYGDFNKYDQQIDNLKLRNRINLQVRYIPETEIPLFFSASDVCVLPYRSATQSGIVGIAYHFDLPVIVTNTGGLAEMVEENQTGLIANEPTVKHLSSLIKKYFEKELKIRFGPGIGNYKTIHSWDNLSGEIISLSQTIK
jgi:glycosyltransferase involved in cell wall biosynthesis